MSIKMRSVHWPDIKPFLPAALAPYVLMETAPTASTFTAMIASIESDIHPRWCDMERTSIMTLIRLLEFPDSALNQRLHAYINNLTCRHCLETWICQVDQVRT
jgi:hypothetical protein